MKRKVAAGLVVLALVIVALGMRFSSPERRAARYVDKNGTALAAFINSGRPLPAAWDGETVQVRDGEHPMAEIILGHGIGDKQYWGVYYSPDDVPLPFQNTGVPLASDGETRWIWQAEGDNHGATEKIADRWYYFEACF